MIKNDHIFPIVLILIVNQLLSQHIFYSTRNKDEKKTCTVGWKDKTIFWL